MTLLLKSLWQNVLRGTQFSRPSLSARSLCSSISELTRTKTPDVIMLSIKTAPSASDVLSAVQKHLPQLTPKHMLQAFRSLFQLQKAGKYYQSHEELIKDPSFGILCQNFKKHARSLEIPEAIEAIKVLLYLGVSVDSLIIQSMLQIIRSQINQMNIRQIMFLDFLLSKYDQKNHLVDALKLALPLSFQIHLPLEIDTDDLLLLREMLSFCCSHDLPDRCINNVVTGLLLHDQAIDTQVAKSIIWSLCLVNCTGEVFPARIQLLHICCDVLTQSLDQLTYDDVLRTAAKLKGRILEKHPEYYHESLMDAIANYVVNRNLDFEKGLLIARVLSRIAHTNLGLMEHLCHQAVSNPVTLANARTNILFGFINCLSNNNFTPDQDQWTEIQRQISLNPILEGKSFALPWAKLCLELASLGVYEDRLLHQVFSKEFLDDYLARDYNILDYLQLLTLNEAVKTFHSNEYKLPENIISKAKAMYPVSVVTAELEESLVRGMGSSDYVVKNVLLPCGIVSDLLMYLKGGYPMKLPKLDTATKIPIENLDLPSGGVVVCILNFRQGCFSMNSNRLRGPFRLILDILDRQGYAAVGINTSEWLNAPAHERTPYLLREIGYKCGEIGMKLSAT